MSDPDQETNAMPNDRVAWSPSSEYLERSRLKRFIEHRGMSSLAELQTWSEADPGAYWDAAVQELALTFSEPYSAAVDLSQGKPWAKWFPGGHFNYVANALDRGVGQGASTEPRVQHDARRIDHAPQSADASSLQRRAGFIENPSRLEGRHVDVARSRRRPRPIQNRAQWGQIIADAFQCPAALPNPGANMLRR